MQILSRLNYFILKEHGFAKINKAAEIASQSLAIVKVR